MFSLLLHKGTSVNTKFPIERRKCGAWIRDYTWDLSELEFQRGAEKISYNKDGVELDFFVRLCGGFQPMDIPYKFDHMEYYSFAVCQKSRSTCWGLASNFSLDYEPYNAMDFKDGITLTLMSQPVEAFLTTLSTFKLNFDIKCNAAQTNPKAEAQYEVYLGESGRNQIKVTFEYSKGCGTRQGDMPTPTPEYTPQCDFEARDPSDPLMGIDMDLKELNGGPYGHMYFDSINGKDYWLFYQPCERSHNPANFSDKRWGSTWLCDGKISQCEILGHVDNYTVIEMELNNFQAPVRQQIQSHTSKKTIVYWNCDLKVPDNTFLFRSGELTDNDYLLELKITSQESCRKAFPPPTPQKDKCTFDYLDYHFDASKLNSTQYVGYVQQVNVKTAMGTSKQLLHFQPCEGIFCPKDASCDQFEDAYIWLCKEAQVHSDKYDCDPYGLVSNKVVTSTYVSSNPDAGIMMTYKGGDYLTAKVVYECDRSTPAGEIRLDNSVEIIGNTLYLTVRTQASCGKNDPDVRFQIPWPTKGATPTPTPQVHPRPNLFYENGTSFVIVDLHDADLNVDEQKFIVAQRGKIASINHFFSPFATYECPHGYDCREFSKDFNATSWMCWTDENKKDVCFPDAVIHNEITMNPIDDKDFDKGATITYNGAYHVDLQLNIQCDPKAVRDLPLSEPPSYSFNSQTGAMELTFGTVSSMVCPHRYDQPYTPRKMPTPSPDPEVIKHVVWNADFNEDGHNVELDMTRVPKRVVADVALGSGTKYERHKILWSPMDRVDCLENYDCQGFGPANVWKCFLDEFDKPVCYPTGNAEYGMTMELAPNTYWIHADVGATYAGGHMSKTSFLFVCNHSTPAQSVYIDPVGEQMYAAGQMIIIYVHSQHVCWDIHPTDESTYNSTSGGAIFLGIMGSVAIAYMAFGAIFGFCATGSMSLPNEGFWHEFGQCVASGAIFIGTCGKQHSSGVVNYDAI